MIEPIDRRPRRKPGTQPQGFALVLLLAFMAVAITITTASTIVTIINTRGSSDYSLGQDALSIAESGADNAIMRFMRDRTYTGETLTIGSGTATITVSGTTTVTVTSTGQRSGFVRKVQAVLTVSNNIVTLTSWTEIP
jgi:Tfp pilus assembly protein PilX